MAAFDPAFTRRAFLGSSAAVLGASALSAAPAPPSAKFRRFEVTDPAMPSRVLDSYAKGVAEMLKRPPTDPLNWYRNAFIHIFDCPHQNWWFLAWHRGYIGWLEAKIRELSGDPQFALPYWDWTKTARIPAAMFNGVLDPNNSAFVASFNAFKTQFNGPVNALFASFSAAQKNVLAARGVNSAAVLFASLTPGPQGMFFNQPNARGLTAANPDLDSATKAAVSMATIRSALKASTFAGAATGTGSAGFSSAMAASHNDSSREGILESQPHDNVHGSIGGASGKAFMVSFMSPVDPIFFLHHANLDRLWDVWTRRQAERGRPTLPTGANLTKWSNEKFLFFTNQKGQAAAKTKAGDYASMASFDYDYSPGSGEDQVPLTEPLVAARPPQRFGAAVRSRQIGAAEPAGGVAQVPTAVLAAPAPEAPAPVAEVTLNLAPADRGRRFRVLMSVGGGSPVDAGGITVFGHHSHGPTTFAVPIPEGLGAATSGTAPLDIRVVPVERTE
ncbi:MAG: tyrosinase, partial [Hyphomicrobiales bacterium]|nr:tyrosinase [Hyphomicrobiales bacterium]